MTKQNDSNTTDSGQTNSGSHDTILIISDDKSNCVELQQLLRFDYSLVVRNTDEALDAFNSFNIDLIIIDIDKSGDRGIEAHKLLKEKYGHRNIPVVFLTEFTSPLEDALILEEAGIDFVNKPYHPIALLTRIRTSLSIKSSMDVLRRHALLDAHTGIATMHYFRVVFDREWRYALLHKSPISIMRVCVDDHKRYESYAGVQSASTDFKLIAGALKTSLKQPRDLIASLHPYEFMCLYPLTDTIGCEHLAEKLRKIVEGLAISHSPDACQSILTVSIGISSVIPTAKTPKTKLFDEVITNLLEAQNNGGNQFI